MHKKESTEPTDVEARLWKNVFKVKEKNESLFLECNRVIPEQFFIVG